CRPRRAAPPSPPRRRGARGAASRTAAPASARARARARPRAASRSARAPGGAPRRRAWLAVLTRDLERLRQRALHEGRLLDALPDPSALRGADEPVHVGAADRDTR